MIKSFLHKGLSTFHNTGSKGDITPEHAERLAIILDTLETSKSPSDMDLPGLHLHPLHGDREGFWAVWVNSKWRVMFKFEGDNAVSVDYDNYH